MRYFCCDKRRRNELDQHPTLNGIDYLEVLDRDAPTGSPRQRTLLVRCLKMVSGLTRENVRIEGGERITSIDVEWAFPVPEIPASLLNAAEQTFLSQLDEPDHVLVVRTSVAGDFSRYELALVVAGASDLPPSDFDELFSRISFSFKVECGSEFDCRPARDCAEPAAAIPEFHYLAKDYASFRQLMFDRLAITTPRWRDHNAADLGTALVELLAYVGDRLSYEQDAVATEAYLGTARRRVSVARHARLVDYFMHQGCNARAWVQLQVDADVVKTNPQNPAPVPRGTRLLSKIPAQPIGLDDDPRWLEAASVVFETKHDLEALWQEHNIIPFYSWSDRECCLPKGATAATLRGHLPNLKVGDVLIFEEVVGPKTGNRADADSAKRCAVRLTRVDAGNPVTPRVDALNGQPVTEIEWDEEDALPFPLCLSSRTDESNGEAFVDEVSVARGNIVLADHGQTVAPESLGSVPDSELYLARGSHEDRCQPTPRQLVPVRFRPRLRRGPLTFAIREVFKRSASATMTYSASDAIPQISLTGERKGTKQSWRVHRDLLSSNETDRHFVIESESEHDAVLRFGDDQHGMRPLAGDSFEASYRIGNGVSGNVGADSLHHIVSNVSAITQVRNPLPAAGGVEPESIESVRQRAPYAFLRQQRAVTPADYAEVTERDSQVQRAAATFRWTGFWHTVFVTADRRGGLPVDREFERQLRRRLERYRMAGYDLEVDGPRFVSLELEMLVCVHADYFRSDVERALRDVFSRRTFSDGRCGLFHPDNFTFGQPVFLSPFYAAAQSIAGVESARIVTFQRQGNPDPEPLRSGRLSMHRLEIARLDNDPNFPERGVFRLKLGGGK